LKKTYFKGVRIEDISRSMLNPVISVSKMLVPSLGSKLGICLDILIDKLRCYCSR
jgi:hypothetical protein